MNGGGRKPPPFAKERAVSTMVYLDSSDFSDLSHSESKLSDENRVVLNELRSRVLDGSAQILLSGIHLSEAVHASEDPTHKQAAVRRATLMQELCASNFLRLPHEILRLEIAKAMDGAKDARLSRNELVSAKSEWFGLSLTADIRPDRKRAMIELEKHTAHLPRHERRKLKSEWKISTGRGRSRWRELLSKNNQAPVQEFPFSLLDNQFALDWLIGDRSEEEFRERLIQVLNDPKGLVECVLDLTNERETIYSLLRNQGEKNCSKMERSLQSIFDALSKLTGPVDNSKVSKVLRQAIRKLEFGRIVVSQFAGSSVDHLDGNSIDRLVTACPAVSTFVSMYAAYAWALVESNLQRWRAGKASVSARKASDFGDMMHSVYVP
jgi:hypothetical protein